MPAFLFIAIARAYANASSDVVLVMLGATIALMVLSAQVNRERDWSTRGVGYSELIRKNSTQAAMMLSAVLVFAAGGITSVMRSTSFAVFWARKYLPPVVSPRLMLTN